MSKLIRWVVDIIASFFKDWLYESKKEQLERKIANQDELIKEKKEQAHEAVAESSRRYVNFKHRLEQYRGRRDGKLRQSIERVQSGSGKSTRVDSEATGHGDSAGAAAGQSDETD